MKALALLLALPLVLPAQQLEGKWTFTFDAYGTPSSWPLTLAQRGDAITGRLGGDAVTGTLRNGTLTFHAADAGGGYEDGTATLTGDTLTGTFRWAHNGSVSHPSTHAFTAVRNSAPVTSSAPRMHEFTPTVFRRQFSSEYAPVLTVNSGDTIHTTTVDAGGFDFTGTPRSLGGNPQTGPFYVTGANPGDILAVHIRGLKLNRDWAISTDAIVDRANPPGIASRQREAGKQVRWHLDLANGTASPESPGPHMQRYSVPVKPMLGCIAVATGPGGPAPRTGDSGNFGGNIDYNEVVEGTTLYLPVSVPGALLYFGDGHALQGDGETTGDALETSMDVTVTVEVVHDVPVRGPFLETPTHMVAIGLDGSIDTAFQDATERMENYLRRKYQLTPPEFAMVLGSAASYTISEVADRNAGVALKISKRILAMLEESPKAGR